MKRVLLIIDPQNDFVNSVDGSLYVPNAEEAIKNLINFLTNNRSIFDKVIATQDYHPKNHIGFSSYWENNLEPFTIIKSEEVGVKYFPKDRNKTEDVKKYLKNVEDSGSAKHTIWPNHCVNDTWGYFIPGDLGYVMEPFDHYLKGTNPDKEMYSAISYSDGEITEDGSKLLEVLSEFDEIFIAGVAKDYCVAETVRDLVKAGLSSKLVFLGSCMAGINENNESLKIFQIAEEGGARYE